MPGPSQRRVWYGVRGRRVPSREVRISSSRRLAFSTSSSTTVASAVGGATPKETQNQTDTRGGALEGEHYKDAMATPNTKVEQAPKEHVLKNVQQELHARGRSGHFEGLRLAVLSPSTA